MLESRVELQSEILRPWRVLWCGAFLGCCDGNLPFEGRRTMWDGTVSGTEFHAESMAFLALWNGADTTRSHWQWQPWADSTAGGYLTLEDRPTSTAYRAPEGQRNLEASDCLSDSTRESDDVDDSTDSAALVLEPVSSNQHASFTYHVIYSESYKVPTLFFRGFYADGGLLTVGDVRRSLTADSLLLLENSPWTFLTQEEHPALHRPWFSFHPCGTSKMMALILSDWLRSKEEMTRKQSCQHIPPPDGTSLPGIPKTACTVPETILPLHPTFFSGQYLLTWLSILRQVTRLDLPLDLFKKLSTSGTNFDGQ